MATSLKDVSKIVWQDSKVRNRLILCLLVFIFVLILVYNLMEKDYYDERMAMCPETKKAFIARVKNNDLSKVECPECHGPVGLAFKCLDCDYEFCYFG